MLLAVSETNMPQMVCWGKLHATHLSYGDHQHPVYDAVHPSLSLKTASEPD